MKPSASAWDWIDRIRTTVRAYFHPEKTDSPTDKGHL